MKEILDSLSNAWLIIFCRRKMSGRHIMIRFLILLVFSTLVMKSCLAGATDTLLPTQSIRDGHGQTLVSANKTFEFGFFSPGNSSNRYVGIWYHNISVITAVWVANRDGPIADTSGVLTFTGDGNLMVLDSKGRSSVFTYGSGMDNTTVATILDSGNLVLRDLNDSARVLWQSFDNPTDHLLPGMFLGRRGNQNLLLTSWRSPVDPALGEFSFGVDPKGSKQLFIWQQDSIYWTSGPWNGQYFSLLPELPDLWDNFTYVSNEVEEGFAFSIKIPTRFKMDFTGKVEQLRWVREWLLFWAEPRPQCDVDDLCGAFGVCYENRIPYCECLEGFQPGSLTDWNQGVTWGGCLRLTNLESCGSAGGKLDRFAPISHIRFPNDGEATQFGVMRGVQECESACLNNCTCTAYAFTGSCRLWHGDLLNLQHLDDNSGGTLYLRLAASESESGGNNSPEIKGHGANKRKLWLTVTLIAIFVMLSFISIGCLLWWRRRKGIQKLNQEQTLILGTDIVSKLGDNDKRGVEFTLFSFSRIADATCNFSNANKLGEGGFGPVYKGLLLEGQEIAVKRLSAHSGQGLEEFKNEILLIAKLQHNNLVRLLGCCIQREEKILVYEYMINKSLDFFLFDSARGQILDWRRRFHIIEGIAQGLLYLHKYSRLRIIHRDLKASNILLDAEMNPKISDFGMARIFSPNEMEINTNRVVGTYGYMSPEYAAEGLFSTKSDVFSFGVLLLEIVSGKRNTSFHQDNNSLNLLGYAWELWKEGKSLELKDPTLEDTGLTFDIPKCVHIGLLCVQENAADRPTMSNVITMLSSDSTTLPNPKQPAFFTMRYARVVDLPSNMHETNSLNNVTVTSIDGR